MPRATVRDVAHIAGVSARTVSNVVNGFRWVSPETRRVVLAAIDQVGYVPNLSARGLRQGRTGAICLAVPDLLNPWFAELADHVMAAAVRHDLAVVIEQPGGHEAERALLTSPRMTRVDGLLLAALTLDDSDSELLADAQRPVVLMGDRELDVEVDQVTMANRAGADLAASHLLAIGRHRLLVIGADPSLGAGSSALRLKGYRDALTRAGVPLDDELIVVAEAWTRAAGAAAAAEALSRGIAFDGVVAFNDALAIGAINALTRAGLSIPEDVAVTGFDDVEEARWSLPDVTSVDPSGAEIADVAVRYLVDRMKAEDQLPARHHLAGVRLVERGSTRRLPVAPATVPHRPCGARPDLGADSPIGNGSK